MASKLRTVGLLGGMTFDATTLYYSTINRRVRSALGGGSSAPILIHSFDFGTLLPLFIAAEWNEVATIFTDASKGLIDAGAQAIVITANFPHIVADRLQDVIGDIPVLHIADFTGAAIRKAGKTQVGLLGAKAVMEEAYVKERIRVKYGIEVLVPEDQTDREEVHDMLMKDIAAGNITEDIKSRMKAYAMQLIEQGAQGLVLGSTDLGFVFAPGDVPVPLFDTNEIHAEGVAEWVLGHDPAGG